MERERCRLIVPEHCPLCGAFCHGGSEQPGKPFKRGLRVFYRCGASISCGDPSITVDGKLHVRFKNCDQMEDPAEAVIMSEDEFVARYPSMTLKGDAPDMPVRTRPWVNPTGEMKMEKWLYLCERCGKGCSEADSGKVEGGEHDCERWCLKCLAETAAQRNPES